MGKLAALRKWASAWLLIAFAFPAFARAARRVSPARWPHIPAVAGAIRGLHAEAALTPGSVIA